jgi:1,4-dihydroxy-2-naphthoate polyprenyltransferase
MGSRATSRMHVWIEAARPRTLTAALSPVLVGTAAAERFIAWRALAALVVSFGMQVGVNYANDLFDAKRGVDTSERVGPRRATAAGLVSPRQMRVAMSVAFGVACLAGLALAAAVGWELVIVGALCVVAGLAYSGGKKPYASYGLGEVFVFVFFGLVATVGSTYVQDERLTEIAYVAALPVGLLAVAILVVNNLRDIPTDSASGKRTLAVRIGATRTRLLFQALILIALADTIMVAAVDGSFLPLLGLGAIPFAIRPVTLVLRREDPPSLIEALGGTARLQLIYCVLLAIGLWAS